MSVHRPEAPSVSTRPRTHAAGSVRATNQRRVLELLQDGAEAVSQAEIARALDLAPATVSNIVRDLVGAGVLETTLGSGRRGTTVRIARAAGLVAGVDLGYRHLRMALGDLSGQVLASERVPLDPADPSDHALTEIVAMRGRLLEQVRARPGDILNVGLGIPAPVSSEGLVMSSATLPAWDGVDVQRAVAQALRAPVHLDNDANLGALAEHRQGAGMGHDDLAFVKVSSGVGAGLILDGRLFHGAGGTAGEIGHLTLDEQGPLCRCGSRGCLEVYASTSTAEMLAAPQLPGTDFDALVAAATAGHVAAVRIFEDVGLHLGWGMAMVANLFNPSAIVIGGRMSNAGDLLLDYVRLGLRRHALPSVAATTQVLPAALGDQASMIGALLLALERTSLVPAAG